MSARLTAGGTIAERFAIESRVGEGGMAAVYRTRDLSTNTQVAVKLLHSEGRSQYILDHFHREAEILASLKHPRIVGYVAHGKTEAAEPYLAMEWLDGEDLSQHLRTGVLSVQESLGIVAHLAQALAFMHQNGVVHRDIKPANRTPVRS